MPLGLGGGILKGLQDQQARQDIMARQAEESAIRNATQRLNEREFDYRKTRDTRQDTQNIYKEVMDAVTSLYNSGAEGPAISQMAGGYLQARGVTPEPAFMDSLTKMPKSPYRVFQEQQAAEVNQRKRAEIEQRARAHTQRMSAGEAKLFIDTAMKFDASGRDWEKESIPGAWAALQFARMQGAFPPQGTQTPGSASPQVPQAPTPQPPLMDMNPQTPNPLLESLGIGAQLPDLSQSATTAPQATQGAQVPGLPRIGVSPKALTAREYQGSIGRAAELNSKIRKQQFDFNATINPLKKVDLQAKIALSKSRQAKIDAEVQALHDFAPFKAALQVEGVTRAILQNEAISLNNTAKKDLQTWMRGQGAGSEAEIRFKKDAQRRADTLKTALGKLQKQKSVAQMLLDQYIALLKLPMPSQESGNYGTEMQKRTAMESAIPQLKAQVQQAGANGTQLNRTLEELKKITEKGVQQTSGTGKPTGLPYNPQQLVPVGGGALMPAPGSYKTPPPRRSSPQKALKDLTPQELDALERKLKAKGR